MTWHEQAACVGAESSQFTPLEKRGRLRVNDARLVARKFCAPCPVRTECFVACLEADQRGAPPQELVQGGWYWPARGDGRGARPFDLLAPHAVVAADVDAVEIARSGGNLETDGAAA